MRTAIIIAAFVIAGAISPDRVRHSLNEGFAVVVVFFFIWDIVLDVLGGRR